MLFIVLSLALLLDHTFGEPRHYHPLVGLGRIIDWVEARYYRPSRIAGLIALSVVVLPLLIVSLWLELVLSDRTSTYAVVSIITLYVAIGWRSLKEHARRVAAPLRRGELDLARTRLGLMVSRDTEAMTPSQVASATTESVLENGSDAIFAVIFWFMVAGLPGVVIYRVVNTLDAMWGYKSKRYLHFGWAAARLDDVLNWVPARLVVISYGLATRSWWRFRQALSCARTQGRHWKSPNAGPVMAAGAGALNVVLGGDAIYHGKRQARPELGAGDAPAAGTIVAACRLINRTVIVWLAVAALCGVVGYLP
ncbi:adenosylcobinamide-phosphate synthase CbiB [Larsenimonas salina]|uniref:adenosylcobinamide-phosphate synthase CbiB n=1 Tax=Larsenimonas salina TaxID=1295565 RepID=UPI0020734ABF|nr:adenosylcobinamide-phosphate synthase CbiB [Larsenimonas salina]MCM5703638.1 adenosylcobinamide-phosphate synthase CbiB [Larsenimonas salina]